MNEMQLCTAVFYISRWRIGNSFFRPHGGSRRFLRYCFLPQQGKWNSSVNMDDTGGTGESGNELQWDSDKFRWHWSDLFAAAATKHAARSVSGLAVLRVRLAVNLFRHMLAMLTLAVLCAGELTVPRRRGAVVTADSMLFVVASFALLVPIRLTLGDRKQRQSRFLLPLLVGN